MLPATKPQLSVVVLTWNEAANIGPCLSALARQSVPDLEVIVVDAASKDGTVRVIQELAPRLPWPVVLDVGDHRLPIGEARNRGVALAKAPAIAFLSADAEPEEHWAQEALQTLESTDMAFSRQVHAPRRWTIGAAVRGLRYHFPAGAVADPVKYASNVGAAFRREVLEAFPFDPATNAAEDLLLGKRAHEAGYHAAYNPRMVVHHHDVDGAAMEMRKNLREGAGCARHVAELGLDTALLVWGALLGLALLLFALDPGRQTALLFAAVLWLPAARRAWRRRRAMPLWAIVVGFLATPPFDLAFLVTYLGGLAGRRKPAPARTANKESKA